MDQDIKLALVLFIVLAQGLEPDYKRKMIFGLSAMLKNDKKIIDKPHKSGYYHF
ncbi:hypothetical protein FC85_GL001054 [Lentilactobacillus diolivorans DSM 14421]|uniref:Uncharacterized protein n=1 Tax=Lentilactobacillus diolivorans DSM 14421 TaxID=1423739 RepID=A0A0R1S6F6_9LACO|nr:hypothetical protein FC85_GL001054 [Lentilactobacillus diolivorans DSM 14421]